MNNQYEFTCKISGSYISGVVSFAGQGEFDYKGQGDADNLNKAIKKLAKENLSDKEEFKIGDFIFKKKESLVFNVQCLFTI